MNLDEDAPTALSELGGSQDAKRSNLGLAFDTFGSGPSLLLLHGLGSHRGAWSPLIPRLVSHRQVITGTCREKACSGPLPSGMARRDLALRHATA
jgi:hypothetical protein